MSFLVGVLLFFLNLILVVFLLGRTVLLPSALLVLAPTALARRWLRRSSDGKSVFDINVDAKELNSSFSSPQAQGIVIGICVAAFALSGQLPYLLLAGGFGVGAFATRADRLDERSFEQFARALAAVSDAVLFGVLFFVAVFRPQVDAFALLSLMFLLREILLVFARRWLESDPEFSPYEEEMKPESGVQVSLPRQRVGMFTEAKTSDATPSDDVKL
jgi:hypothetical protein